MDWEFIIKGLIIGFSISAPVGPIGILCIRRSLAKGWLVGFLTGLGAATADTFYGIIAYFWLNIVSNFLFEYKIWFQIMGIFFLLYLAIKAFWEEPINEKKIKFKRKWLLFNYLTTFGLTMTNPLTIFVFTAIFTGIGISNTIGNHLSSFFLIFGVFMGASFWRLILSNGIGLLNKKMNHNILKLVNRISGGIIFMFAVILVINLIQSH